MFRLSLRELFVLVAFVALAIVSLRYASDGWTTSVFVVVSAAFYVAGLVAIAARGARRAFACGMVFHMVFYAALIANSGLHYHLPGNPEVRSNGRLPTSRLLGHLYRAFADVRYYDTETGKEVPKPVVKRPLHPPKVAQLSASPPREPFLQIGHYWWALLFGYLGGRFAEFVYERRIRASQMLASESS